MGSLSPSRTITRGLGLLALTGLLGGCVIAPRGAKDEKAVMELAGEPYR